MKKICSLLLIVIILFSIPVVSFALNATDPVTGITYSVPYGWNVDEFNSPKDFLSAKYKKGDALIMFGSMDVWDSIPASEKVGLTRADLDDSAFSEEDIKMLAGVDESADVTVYTKKYGNNNFIMIECVNEYTVLGITVEMSAHMAYLIKNGYVASFQLQELIDENNMPDFESVLTSVDLTNSKLIVKSASLAPSSSSTYTAGETKNSAGGIIVAVVISLAVIAALIWFLKNRGKRDITGESINDRQIPVVEDKTEYNSAQEYMYCKVCGKQIPRSSKFCKYCGNKLL